jgi:hypothetical protein
MLNKKKIHDPKQATALCQEDIISTQGVAEEIMVERDQSKLASAIIQCIHK